MKILNVKKIILFTYIFLSIAACQSSSLKNNSDILWNIVSQGCLPNQKSNNQPAPCAEVVFLGKGSDQGYAILKDRNGPLQYLLLPTTKISGIESPEIISKDAPNYFYYAWISRLHMLKKYNAVISDEDISLAINSSYGRSQNQLHIHISCIRPDVKILIHQNLESIEDTWSEFPGGILGHNYFARRISLEQFKEKNPLKLLANDFPEAKNKMNEFGLALLPIKEKNGLVDFILLVDHVDVLKMDKASVEEVQDHKCPQLF